MNKYTNPFLTIDETLSTLKSLGADPLAPLPGATYPFPWGNSYKNIDWREHILNIITDAIYEHGSHYFTCKVHLTNEGFEAAVQLLNSNSNSDADAGRFPIAVALYLDEYEEHYIEPSPLLRLFTLVSLPGATISEEGEKR